MSELTKYLVLAVAFVAFLLAGYIQGGGEWRGPHSLRKSIHPKGRTIGLQDAHPPSEVAYELSRAHQRASHSRGGLSARHVIVQGIRLAQVVARSRPGARSL
jgi:hypothetical protein